MKTRTGLMVGMGMFLSVGLAAATVTIDPGNGVSTNVTARFTGATDVTINSGATGGGIVTLANPLSTYTGKTTVNSGTLVVPDGDVAKGRSSIGSSGPIVLGAGTLRASGTLGAVVTNTYAASSKLATVLDVQDELHITNDFVQKTGCFIKTGPGTVYFSGARNYFGGTPDVENATKAETTRLGINANGDAPTTGRRGNFVLAEGTMVIEGGYNYFNKHGTSGGGSIGTWMVEDGETEKSAVLEIRGGTNVFLRSIWPGYWNGIAGQTGGASVRSGLRVTGGIVTNGLSGDTVFIGGSSLPSGVTSLDTYPFIEVTGGYMYVGKNIQLGNKAGVNSTLTVSGDGEVYAVTSVGAGYGGGPNTNVVTVSGNGKLTTPYIGTRSEGKSPGVRLDVNILDNGEVTCSATKPFQRGLAGQTVNMLLDGGTFYNGTESSSETTYFPSTFASVRVGTRGFTFGGVKNTSQHQKNGHFQKSIVYTNTHPDEVRQPIDFKSLNDSRRSYYNFAQNCTIDAPVRVWPYSYLLLDKGADIVGGNSLSLGNTSRLRLKGGNHTVDTVSFGFTESANGYNTLMIASNTTLTVTREVLHPGSSYLNVYFYNENLGGITGGAVPGAYTLIAAPTAYRDVLESLAETAKFANSSEDKVTAYRFQTVVEGGQAKLQLVVLDTSVSRLAQNAWSNGSGDGLWKTDGNWDGGAAVDSAGAEAVFSKDASAGGETVTLAGQASAGGIAFSGANGYTVTGGELLLGDYAVISSVAPTTNTIASKLTATSPVTVNPAQTGGGVVKLTGDLSGLAGGLAVNSGTLELEDLSFATDASKLFVGPGTVAYTGPAAELAGVTFASAAPAASVLRVGAPLALGSAASLGTALLVKTGEETLKLKGNGTFTLTGGQPTTAWSGDGIFIGESGDGPKSGMYGVTVREGRLEIGTVGDDSDAPNVTAFSLAAGGQPLEGRTPAEIVMNNGTFTLEGAIKVDGYVGCAATNKLVVNGGTLSAKTQVNVGLASRSAEGLAPAVVELNGGLLESRENNVNMYQNGSEMELFLNSGGTLKTVGIKGGEAADDLRGTAHFDGGTFKPFNNGNNVIYLRYISHAYVGAGGFVIDTSEQGTANTAPCYLNVSQTFEKEPTLGDAPDGGIRVRGNGIVYLSESFLMEGLSGGITVEDGATLIANRSTGGEGTTVRVNAGATLRTYQSGSNPIFADSLVLGEAGATKPTRFEVRSTSGTSIYNCIVSNDFAVVGPVRFGTRSAWDSITLANVTGVYTMFVYRASCDANVDAEKFTLDPEVSSLTADFAKVDVVLGGETGWKALVATVRAAVPGELPRWTSTSVGGNWSDSENWSDATAPNGTNAVARFAAAQAADVPVTLDTAVTVGQAIFEETTAGRGYTLGGANALTFAKDGDALLDVATGGTVTVTAPIRADGILCINAAQSGATRGTSGEVVFGAGALDGFAGTLYPRSGRTTIPSLAWMTDGSQLRLGFGTVKYTGTGETIPGFELWPATKFMATLEVENDLTVTGGTKIGTGVSGCFMKAGPGTLTLKGEGDFYLGNNNNRNYWWGDPSLAGRPENTRCANGDSPTNATVNLSIGAGTLVIGEEGDMTAGPSVRTSAYAAIGLPASDDSDAAVVVNSGTFTVPNTFVLGWYHGLEKPVTAKLTMNGGRADLRENLYLEYGAASTCSPEVEVNGGVIDVAGSVCMGVGQANRSVAMSTGTTSTFTMNGGMVTVQNDFFVVQRDSATERANYGRLYMNGGELDVKRTMYVTRNGHAKSTAQAWLNPGGLLKVGNLTATRTGGAFYFNGGTFLPYGVTNGVATSLATSSLPLYVSTNGAVFNTSSANGGAYAVSAALKHDPALAGKDGGLTKTGTGTLTLSGANTYTGPTIVDQGTLAVSADVPLTDDTVVRAGALLDLGGARTLANLTGDGTVCGNLTLAGALTPQNGVPTVDGDFATTSTAMVDFGCTGDDVVDYGSKHLVLRATGTVDPEIKFKAVNCGQPCTLAASVEDGQVYVLVKSGGTLMLFR